MINEELVSDAGTAIMAADVKGLVGIAKGVHDGDAVVGHVALGVESSVVGGLGRGPIAANVHYNKGEVRRELTCDGVPHVVCLWVSVQQKKRRQGGRRIRRLNARDGDIGGGLCLHGKGSKGGGEESGGSSHCGGERWCDDVEMMLKMAKRSKE